MTKAILGEPMYRGNSDAIISARMTPALVAAITAKTVTGGIAVSLSQESNITTADVFDPAKGFGGFINGADINLCANTVGVTMHGLSVVVDNSNGVTAGAQIGVDADGKLVGAGGTSKIILNGQFMGDVTEAVDNLGNKVKGARINFTGYQAGVITYEETATRKRAR